MKKINVVHLCYSDDYGGASIALKRIHAALSTQEAVNSIVCTVVPSTNSDVRNLNSRWIGRVWQYFITRISYKFVSLVQKTKNPSGRSINFFPSGIVNRLNQFDFDILHLHWIGNETIRIECLLKIKKPIFWTFHDSWALLGAEHTELEMSKRFIEGYKKANRSVSSKGIDIDRWVWERKKKVFSQIKIQPIVVSNWLKELTLKSLLWQNTTPAVISNPIDISEWQVFDTSECQVEFNVPLNSKVIVFGAVNGLTDKIKGYDLLFNAIKLIAESNIGDFFCLVIFGDTKILDYMELSNLRVMSLGRITDRLRINKIYCAGNVCVVPSFYETFGQVALEAILCGTPVVSFETSGLIDIIKDGLNGVFAEPYSEDSLRRAIDRALSTRWDKSLLRETIASRFSLNEIGKKYLSEYLKSV